MSVAVLAGHYGERTDRLERFADLLLLQVLALGTAKASVGDLEKTFDLNHF